MFVDKVPVCDRCSEEPESIDKLEQHVEVMHLPRARGALVDNPPGHNVQVSLIELTTQPLMERARPPWFRLLPSNVNADVKSPKHSVLQRRNTFPYFESTRHSTPFSTPPECLNANTKFVNPLLTVNDPSRIALSVLRRRTLPVRPQIAPLESARARGKQSSKKEFHQAHPSNTEMSKARRASRQGPSIPKNHRKLSIFRRGSVNDPKTDLVATSEVPDLLSADEVPGELVHNAKNLQPAPRPQPPLTEELSSFFSSRKGKYVLPSRIAGYKAGAWDRRLTHPEVISFKQVDFSPSPQPNVPVSYFHPLEVEDICDVCGKTYASGITETKEDSDSSRRDMFNDEVSGFEGRQCQRCQRRKTVATMPGAWGSRESLTES